jgi:GDP-mannose 6-dehydrogenase
VDAIARVGQQIGKAVDQRSVPLTVVLRSTVLPGTTERVLLPALREAAGPGAMRLRVAVNPEFMREGSSLHDFDHPPLVLVGSSDPGATDVVRELYHEVKAPFVQASVRSAEFAKFASNAFHGLKVCFANEMADLCTALGADANEVSRLFLMDRKLNVSEAYLRPGFAFGGSCLPKDLRALVWAARANDVEMPMVSSILPSNEAQVRTAVDAVLRSHRRKIGVVGLAFKPGTDDLRESPVVALVENLIGKGCDVRVLDRNVAVARLMGANRRYIESEIPHIASLLCDSVEEILAHAELLVISSATDDAAAAVAGARPNQTILDLTRGAVGDLPAGKRAGAEACVQP